MITIIHSASLSNFCVFMELDKYAGFLDYRFFINNSLSLNKTLKKYNATRLSNGLIVFKSNETADCFVKDFLTPYLTYKSLTKGEDNV